MKTFNKSVGLVYVLLIFYFIVEWIFKLYKFSFYTYYIDPIVWLGFMFFVMGIVGNQNIRIKDKYGKFQTLLILSISYLIIYFFLGLLFGFEYNPYSRNFFAMLKNIWAFVIIIIFQEKIRSILINHTSNKLIYNIFLILIFVLINMNFSTFLSNLNSFNSLFKYLFGTFLPLVLQQLLYNYLMKNCGLKSMLVYRLPIEVSYVLVPIFPKLDWFILGLYNIIFCFAVFLIINYEYVNNYNDRKYRKVESNPISYIPLLIFIIVFICFVMGVFKYRPLAIMSNSMLPYFSRGDMVIIKKINKEDLQNLTINDIIEYRINNHIVVHRIIEIKENGGNLYFRTKGDNNNAPDTKYVSTSQITGIAKIVIPKLGYPTVWLSDLFTNTKPDVEMG